MENAWMMMTGCAIVGWIIPEIFFVMGARVPATINIMGAIAGVLISGYFVL